MDVLLIVAGSLAVVGAALHGIGGELLVIRKLEGPPATRAMIHVTWHIATVAFLAVGLALIAAGAILDGDRAEAVAVLGAAASTGFAAVTLGISAARARSARFLVRHPGPAVLTATAVLAWLGAL